ncbi:insecticidal delta-endotoxin Cry8Ea1 family protein, partial [Bacillus cereus]
MNQNYNNNKYEILKNRSGGYQLKYPLAQAPGTALQNMDYKNCMNMCASAELMNNCSELIKPANALRVLTIVGSGLAWALLTIIPGINVAAAATAAAVAGTINVLSSYYWPELKCPDGGKPPAPGTPESQITWKQMMTAAEEITNKAIEESRRADAIARWEGIQSFTRDYYQALCNLINDPDNEYRMAAVRDAFDDVEDYLKASMPFFRATGFELQMLSMYAQAANYHLMLLRDVVRYGREWGFQQHEIDQYYSNTGGVGNPGLVQLLATYTDYCVMWYTNGLQQQYNTGDWNKFNNFRRDMTLSILDTVAVWPTYDSRKYYHRSVKSQLSRIVYSSIVGTTGGTGLTQEGPTSIAEIESKMVESPQLFRFLDLMTVEAISGVQTSVIRGRSARYFYTNNPFTKVYGGYVGDSGTMKQSMLLWSPPDVGEKSKVTDLFKIETTGVLDNAVSGFVFYPADPEKEKFSLFPSGNVLKLTGLPCRGELNPECNPCSPNNPCISTEIGLNDICDSGPLYSHRLLTMNIGILTVKNPNFATPGTKFAAYFSYALTHVSADHYNKIELNLATQIPAVKASSISEACRVVKGPGSTGGDLVEITPQEYAGPIRSLMYLNFLEPAEAGTEQAYLVRIRYASDMDSRISSSIFAYSNIYMLPDNLPATTSKISNLTYETFGYKDLLVYIPMDNTKDKENTIRLEVLLDYVFLDSREGKVLLDKIEFIPLAGTFEAYRADQELEKAKKAVSTTLFTDAAKNALKLNVMDYAVDQAANLVECVSEEFHAQEKMILLDQVKFAKR